MKMAACGSLRPPKMRVRFWSNVIGPEKLSTTPDPALGPVPAVDSGDNTDPYLTVLATRPIIAVALAAILELRPPGSNPRWRDDKKAAAPPEARRREPPRASWFCLTPLIFLSELVSGVAGTRDFENSIGAMAPTQTQPPGAPSTWAVVILRGKEVKRLGTVEAPDQREAYRLAIEQFNVPVERQNRLFVRRLRSA